MLGQPEAVKAQVFRMAGVGDAVGQGLPHGIAFANGGQLKKE